MSFILKKIATPLLLASFLTVAFFGFTFMFMSHGSDGRMQSDCPFSAAGCPQDTFAAAMHHLTAYQSFFSVSVGTAMTALIDALSILALFVLISPFYLFILRPPVRVSGVHYAPPLSSRTRKITHWLALLEHSPSLT